MDLSQLSEADLQALQAGNMAGVSDEGLQHLSGQPPAGPAPTAGERFMRGVKDPIEGGTQLGVMANDWLANKGVVPRLASGTKEAERIAHDQKDYETRRGPDAGIDWLRLGGNAVSPATIASMFMPGGTLLRAAMAGGVGGAMNPTDSTDDFAARKATQVGAGAATGGAFNLAGRALSRIALPNAAQNTQLQLLKGEGVEPTIGQALGGGAKRVEEQMTSLPVLGGAIGAAQGRAREGFDRAAINRATGPIGQRIEATGNEGVAQAGDAIGATYDRARSMGGARLDRPGIQELRTIMDDVSRMPANEQQAWRSLLDTIGTDVSAGGRIADFKRVDSEVGRRAANFSGGASTYERDLGDAMSRAQAAIRGSVGRRNPQAGAAFDSADRAWANLVPVENASKAAANQDGQLFTPAQLMTGIRTNDKTVRDRATSRGEALMQDLASAGSQVLGNRTPDSGTAGRTLLARGLGYGVGIGAGGYGAATDPESTAEGGAAVLAALLAGRRAYTPGAQRALVRLVSQRGPGWQTAAMVLRQAANRGAGAVGEASADAGGAGQDGYFRNTP